MPLSSTIQIIINGTVSKSGLDLSQSASMSLALNLLKTITDGKGADQAEYVWADTRSLVATSEDIDVVTPAATDQIGNALTLAEIKLVFVRNNSTTDNLTVGNKNTTAAWMSPFNASDTGALTLGPGGFIVLCAPGASGYAAATTTNHLLKIDAGAATISYDIILIGNAA